MDTSGLDDFDDLLQELPTAGTGAQLVLHRNHRPLGPLDEIRKVKEGLDQHVGADERVGLRTP
jgi:hypothetical protein